MKKSPLLTLILSLTLLVSAPSFAAVKNLLDHLRGLDAVGHHQQRENHR